MTETRPPARWRRYLPDGFVVAMLGAVALAVTVPQIGLPGGVLHLDVVTHWGIALVFFLHGANLSPQVALRGLAHWRLHLFVQASTFILFPLIGAAILLAGGLTTLPHGLLIGFFYLCALPSTVSSSVAMTALGRGNVPAAVFNASLSGLIGMIVTPLLVGLVVASRGGGLPSVIDAIGDVALTLLLPFVLGQLSRVVTAGFLGRHKRCIGLIDRAVIVLIVFTSFAVSTAAGTWSSFGIGLLALTAAGAAIILVVALVVTVNLSRLAGFTREDEVTAVFCGSKKSLASGAPMAGILFAGAPSLGMIMLPILLYHQLQLIVCSVLARRYAARAAVIA
jgi:sodium/bile acid cotransporter 7